MGTLLEVIGAEREALQAKLTALDEIERLATAYENGAAAQVAAPEPPAVKKPVTSRVLPAKTKATGQGRDGLKAGTIAVLDALREARGEWVSPSDLPGAKSARSVHCNLLIERGLVEDRGAARNRMYRAVNNGNWTGGGRAANGTTFGSGNVMSTKHKPTANGKVLAERIVGQLRHRKLNEPQLAGVLDVGREDVADVCGSMLLEDRIVLQPDGTYTLPLAVAS